MKTKLGVTALISILLGLMGMGVYYYLTQPSCPTELEWVYTGEQGEARRNPFFASEALLKKLGYQVHSVRQLQQLPLSNTQDRLLLNMPAEQISETQTQRLLEWISNGGRLLVTARDSNSERAASLLRQLRIFARPAPQGSMLNLASLLCPLKLDAATTLQLQPKLSRVLYHSSQATTPRWKFECGEHILGLELTHGQGSVVILTDLYLFDNDRLEMYDHAPALLALLQIPAGGTVWVQRAPELPSWLAQVWALLWPLLAGLGLALGLWLWALNARLAPFPALPALPGSRALRQQINAGAQFYQRYAPQYLLQGGRWLLEQRLRQRYPSWLLLPKAQLVELLSQRSGINPSLIETALGLHDTQQPPSMATLVKLYQAL